MRTIVLALALLLAGCGPEYGFVVSKWDVPAHTTTHLMQMSCGEGCTMWIPTSNYVPRACYVRIEGEGGDGDRQLTCESWEGIATGQWLDLR